jgi:hypothetical protein
LIEVVEPRSIQAELARIGVELASRYTADGDPPALSA